MMARSSAVCTRLPAKTVGAEICLLGQDNPSEGLAALRTCQVEMSLGVPRIYADAWDTFSRQRMIEPYRKRAGLEHDALCMRRTFA
jgi:hypothetical protein